MRLTTHQGTAFPAPQGDDRRLIEAAIEDDAKTLQALLAGPADINARDEYGMTPLHHAAATGARACLRLLIAAGRCDFLLQDGLGRYASDLAIEWARDYAVARLLTRKQIQQARREGRPAWLPPGTGRGGSTAS